MKTQKLQLTLTFSMIHKKSKTNKKYRPTAIIKTNRKILTSIFNSTNFFPCYIYTVYK